MSENKKKNIKIYCSHKTRLTPPLLSACTIPRKRAVRGIDFASSFFFTIFILDFKTVLTVWYFFVFYFIIIDKPGDIFCSD
jgi:hypothetical protein